MKIWDELSRIEEQNKLILLKNHLKIKIKLEFDENYKNLIKKLRNQTFFFRIQNKKWENFIKFKYFFNFIIKNNSRI